MTDVILLSHGSPDPRARAAAEDLGRRVQERSVADDLPVRIHNAVLDHGPSLTEVTRRLADRDVSSAIVVPAFVTPAFHVRVDVPAAREEAERATGVRLHVTDPIGTDRLLIHAMDDALPDGPVVLAVAGTRDAQAIAALEEVSTDWARDRGASVTVGHASQSSPTVSEALAKAPLASVASLVLYPGVLPDRIRASAADRVTTEPLYAHDATVQVILERIRGAA